MIITTNILFPHFRETFIPVQTKWTPLRNKKRSNGKKRRAKRKAMDVNKVSIKHVNH